MTVYIVKDALTKGIETVTPGMGNVVFATVLETEVRDGEPEVLKVDRQNSYSEYYFVNEEKREWCSTFGEAVAAANAMRRKHIDKLEKDIEETEALLKELRNKEF